MKIEEKTAIKLFEEKLVRTAWNEDEGEWYFSIVDVVTVLTDSENPRRYWSDLKIKLAKEGSQLYEEIVQLKLPSADGKRRNLLIKNGVEFDERSLEIGTLTPALRA